VSVERDRVTRESEDWRQSLVACHQEVQAYRLVVSSAIDSEARVSEVKGKSAILEQTSVAARG